MEGEAKFFFNQHLQQDEEAGNVASVADWKDRLQTRFAKSFAVQMTEIRGRKMKPNETATEYVDAITRIGKSMQPTDE